MLLVLRGVGEIERRAVDAHQAQAAIEGTLGLLGRHRGGDGVKQRLDRLGTKPGACFEEGRFRRDLPGLLPRCPRQALDEVAHHFLVGGVREEREAEHVVDDDACGQQAVDHLLAASFGNDAIDEVSREDPREHADRDVVGQALVGLRLDPSRPEYGPENNSVVVLRKRYWI